ncbi:DUF2705 family protein [Bacillus altitudinis]|uniref:DUF2705 family protein n=1 Tax=Bacillus altitudinis TaxID=293387 RepID=UPI001B83995C|nr:DUF2705 family protein [Bacillus altitudinis]MBR0581375.1 DUF2705 family protein [Bacillus altitudinis A23-8]
MKIKGIFWIFLSIVFQMIFIKSNSSIELIFPFLSGVPVSSSTQLENLTLLYWYLPIVAMSFYFSGYIRDNLYSYGKLKLVRNYNKSKWIVLRFTNMMLTLLGFVLIQILVFYLSSIYLEHNFNTFTFTTEIFMLIIMYFLTLLCLFSIQLTLELFITPQLSQLALNMYIIVSIFAAKQLYTLNAPSFLYYVLIPNYNNGFRTGLSHFNGIEKYLIHYPIGLLILIILQIGLVFLAAFKIKKMDIL